MKQMSTKFKIRRGAREGASEGAREGGREGERGKGEKRLVCPEDGNVLTSFELTL